ncbi:MAG: flagellar basal-body MS-ring/collar protein FliF [Paracoccaceae bacterium]|nr:flagellar basal-body MS-ring/collar protein FliF [Paracoccaceae bacterium]
MQQIATLWAGLDPRKRSIVGLATAAMFIAVLLLSRMAATPNMTLLYAGMESGAAGEVLAALDQRGVTYDVRGDAIFVESGQRDSLRMSLASEGLPAASSAGYELLDGMSGFGTTSQMFDAAYWRAKEGELARSITASPYIRAARVHISNADSQPFRQDSHPTASVTVTSGSGSLSPSQAKALKYLVASAVRGMTPEDVSVIDTEGGLILTGEEADAQRSGADRAAELKRNIERLLAARVGLGNAVVELSIDTQTESESITERRFDPEGRVAISTDTEQRTATSKDEKPGAVTVASNLPEGDAAGGGNSQSQNSESRERTNFEVSEVQRQVVRAPGAVRRVTVAVLVDGVTQPDAAGQPVFTPRSPEELADLRDLVASAVGFDEARGDVITIKSMAFEPLAPPGSMMQPSVWASMGIDAMTLIQLAVLAIVALALGLFVVRPILTSAGPAALARPDPTNALPRPDLDEGYLTGEIDDRAFDPSRLPIVSMDDGQGPGFGESADPVERLRQMIAERQDETVEILRSWMEDREENA